MPETLIVGIVNTERDRDFRPPMVPTAPDSETFAADKFLEFIVDELIPWTQAHYRTAAYRVLAGHSDGGLFTSYALVNRPKAFQSYIALSPALQEAKGSTLADLQLALTRVDAPLQLFLSWSGTDIAIRASTQNLVTALTKRPPCNVRWTHREYLDDTHASTFHRGLYDALEWAFAGWPMPVPKDTTAFEPTIAEIDAHYAALSKKFGFQVIAPPNALHRAAQALMKRKQTEAALDVWRRTARDYPYLTDGYSSLGRALEQLGRTNEARQAYEQALRVSAESQSAFNDTRSLQQRVKALRSQPESQR
ncbi:MAG: hypothetical protein JNL55_30060 [Steroidobacter sp.]|nr:hypothetical protein [Steroidobacter sp.]